MKNRHIKFLLEVGKKKPNNILNKDADCPFCSRETLVDIIDEEYPFMLLENKYTVLENSFQTVLIETEDCDSNMSMYEEDHMRRLLKFAVKHWLRMETNKDYRSVILFKNHGHYSGGSIKHSHMQIVGFKDIDYKELTVKDDFEGILIREANGCILNLSIKPKSSFTEFNIIIEDINNLDAMADTMQVITHYILNNYPVKCQSFNLFFYHLKNQIICKVIPRFVASPLFIGYGILQVSSNLDIMVKEIKKIYYAQ